MGRRLLIWLKEEWSLRSRDRLDMVEVYQQIGKCFSVGDTLDMFVWVRYAEKDDSGVYADPTFHVFLFQPSNIGYLAPLPFPRTSAKNEPRTLQSTYGPMVVATPRKMGPIGIPNAESNCATSAMVQALYACQLARTTLTSLSIQDLAPQRHRIGEQIKDIFGMMDNGAAPVRLQIVALHSARRNLMVESEEREDKFIDATTMMQILLCNLQVKCASIVLGSRYNCPSCNRMLKSPTSTIEYVVHGALLSDWSNCLASTFQPWRIEYITCDTCGRMAATGDGIAVHPTYLTSDVIVLFLKPQAMDGHDLLFMPYLHLFLVPDTFHFNNNIWTTTSTIAHRTNLLHYVAHVLHAGGWFLCDDTSICQEARPEDSHVFVIASRQTTASTCDTTVPVAVDASSTSTPATSVPLFTTASPTTTTTSTTMASPNRSHTNLASLLRPMAVGTQNTAANTAPASTTRSQGFTGQPPSTHTTTTPGPKKHSGKKGI